MMSGSGIISGTSAAGCSDYKSDSPTSVFMKRQIMVANFLPLQSVKDRKTGQWFFEWDENSLLLHMKDGFSSETEVFYVGSLKVDIDVNEQEHVAQKLLEEYRCVPTFLPHALQEKFYHGFCKQKLWPLFHNKLPFSFEGCDFFDPTLVQASFSANNIFADKVMEILNSDHDYIWIHDYHLMLLPTLLRKRMNQLRLGFYLHCPFPSSEIFKIFPFRKEILQGLLNADLIGFQTFDYARHFLSCCSRMLGLDHEFKHGCVGVEYYGRTVCIKVLPVGVHVGRLESMLNFPSTIVKVQEIEQEYEGKTLFLGVDDIDTIKGIDLKLLALEFLLERHADLRGKVVLVQILNPPRSRGKDVTGARNEVVSIAERINNAYGHPGYEPVVLIQHAVLSYEKIAFYAVADCCIVSALSDGMNLVPYQYIVCRQGTEVMDRARGPDKVSPHASMLILSEFIGCSPSLSGAFRVNPWNVEDVANALFLVAHFPEKVKQLRHEKHYRYVNSHDVIYWVRSFIMDLQRACEGQSDRRCWCLGFGLSFRICLLPPNFRKPCIDEIVSSYRRTNSRAIFLDYDGTMMPEASDDETPGMNIISILNDLCHDPKNKVFIVSGRGRTSLSEWFSSCENLGIAAEHGYFIRWSKASEWEAARLIGINFEWKCIAEALMTLYTEATDGSYIESKETALVWHFQKADIDFGSQQAKELLDHLENMLANEPVVVRRGQHIVEVKPQGISKGWAVEKILRQLVDSGKPPEFMMCIGNDRSDEDMFECINKAAWEILYPTVSEVFTCTVGQKPSKAKYFVEDADEVSKILSAVTCVSTA